MTAHTTQLQSPPAASSARMSPGTAVVKTTGRRARPTPHPNSVLDRHGLVACLEKEGLYGTSVQPVHVAAFYQALHRQNYPELSDFVSDYYKHQQDTIIRNLSTATPTMKNFPIKNRVSGKKNRNRMQLPKAFLQFLATTDALVTVTSRVARQKTSADGSTTKLAIELHDGQLVEAVLMRYTRASAPGSRASLCVSSQCGCAMGCTFCATGTMGLSGNMSAGEILEQVVHADRILAQEYLELKRNHTSDGRLPKIELVRNIVFMGMGEPLDNYKNVVEACRALIDNKRWSLAHGRVTVSTVGIVNMIRKLSQELPQVSLALSLHAPNQAIRSAIVPTAKHFPIDKLIDALDEHMMAYLRRQKMQAAERTGTRVEEYTVDERRKESTRRRAMIEYVMLEGETSTIEAAHQLGKLCEGRQLIVNLIPYNKTDVKDKLSCPSSERMQEFQRIVTSYGTFCTVRRTMGADIDSACGQLVTLETRNDASCTDPVRDIEDAATSVLHEVEDRRSRNVTRTQRNMQLNDRVGTGKDSKLELDDYVLPLAVATTLAAISFIVSSALFIKQQRR